MKILKCEISNYYAKLNCRQVLARSHLEQKENYD